MCRDGRQSAHGASRRAERWQMAVKVQPTLRTMTRMKATTIFKERKMSFVARIERAIWTKMAGDAPRYRRIHRTLVRSIAESVGHPRLELWVQFMTDLLVVRRPAALLTATASFMEWLSETALSVAAVQSEQERWKPRNFRHLPALRLHVVGRGRVGKNFPPTVHQFAARQRTRCTKIAKNICRTVPPQSAHVIPACIIREASGRDAQRARNTLSTPSESDIQQHQQEHSRHKICHFLRLPAEIRNAIYAYALASDGDTDSSGEVNLLTATSPTPALPLTCRQIGEECGLMYLNNFRNFWRDSQFYIDASALYTGWHIRPAISLLPQRETQKITSLRIAFVAKNGIYNAIFNQDHWLVRRVGGPCPSGRGATGTRSLGVDEIMIIFHCSPQARCTHHGDDYVMKISSSAATTLLSFHQRMIGNGRRMQFDLREQIVAVIERLHKWV